MSEVKVCDHCQKEFYNKSSLTRHQKTSLKCNGSEKVKQYKCKYCSSEFTVLNYKNVHEKKCQSKAVVDDFQEKMDDYEEKISTMSDELQEKDETIEHLEGRVGTLLSKNKKLKELVAELKSRVDYLEGNVDVYDKWVKEPRIKGKNITINEKIKNIVPCGTILPFTPELVEEARKNQKLIKSFKDKCGAGEYDAIADLIISMMRKGKEKNYICTNTHKGTFYYLLTSRDWKSDNKSGMIKVIIDVIAEAFEDFYDEEEEAHENWLEELKEKDESPEDYPDKETAYQTRMERFKHIHGSLKDPESKLWKDTFKLTVNKVKGDLKIDLS